MLNWPREVAFLVTKTVGHYDRPIRREKAKLGRRNITHRPNHVVDEIAKRLVIDKALKRHNACALYHRLIIFPQRRSAWILQSLTLTLLLPKLWQTFGELKFGVRDGSRRPDQGADDEV
jgi:hypothetical protein